MFYLIVVIVAQFCEYTREKTTKLYTLSGGLCGM